MIRPPPKSTRTDPLVPYSTLLRSCSATSCALRLATCRPSNAPITSVHGIIRADNRTIVRAANTSPKAANFLLDSRGEATVDQPSVDNPVSWWEAPQCALQIGRASWRERVCQYV